MKRFNFWQKIKAMFFGWNKMILPSHPVKYVVVVAYGLNMDGTVSPGEKRFVDRALELIEKGKSEVLCLTGGNCLKNWGYMPALEADMLKKEAEAMLDYALNEGYDGKFILEKRSCDTFENFQFLLEEIRKSGDSGLIEMIVINHPEHLGRAICLAQAQDIIVWPVPVKVLWGNSSVPKYTRNRSVYKRRQFVAACHHLFHHFFHITGLKRSHPWM